MSLKSAAWRIAKVAFLFLARIRFPGHILLAGTLQKRYGRDLVKEVRALENLNFQNRKALLDLDFSILCRNKNVIPKFLHFKVSNKELRKSNAYVIYQKCLVNQKTSNKQKVVKTLKPLLETIKKNVNVKMNYKLHWLLYLCLHNIFGL